MTSLVASIGRTWARYNELCITRPLTTKGLTGGFLFSTGDLIAQKLDGTLARYGLSALLPPKQE